ncbi:AMP-dependent synthetase/ligase [Alkalibacillus aidingensis]|uniref:AMP-dependent synthetase/ligase n=1 Tax=Alkalibacillus aidingensis TaxID=2747607 RepID=UPI001660BC3E|nr:AMP-binding protein [Alkalibacillus aidingensis]
MRQDKTLVQLFLERAEANPDQVAYRYKDLGIWNEVKWKEFREQVESLGIMLQDDFQVQPGEKVAIIGENKPEWTIVHLATQLIGAIPVGVYELFSDKLVEYLKDFEPKLVIVGGFDHKERLLAIQEKIPFVKKMIDMDEQGEESHSSIPESFFRDVLEEGKNRLKEQPNFIKERIDESSPNDVTMVAYTEESEQPREVFLTHKGLITSARRICDSEDIVELDDYLPIMPLASMNEYLFTVVLPIYQGIVVNYPEKPNTVLKDLIELGPHSLVAPSRVYQKIRSQITLRMKDSTRFKRKTYHLFQHYSEIKTKAKGSQTPVSKFVTFMNELGDLIIHRFIRYHYGLHRVKQAFVIGEPIDEATYLFFKSMGVPIRHTYSANELAGIGLIEKENDEHMKSSCVPLPGIEVDIREDDEIYIKSASSTEENEEYQATGDCGVIEDGQLRFFGKKQEQIILTSGEVCYPLEIENKLKESLYIKEAVCFGNNRDYLTAILNIDPETTGRWADQNQLAYTTYEDLSKHERVIQLIEQEVSNRMEDLPTSVQIHNFVLLPKMLSEEEGELTHTLQVRRKFVEQKYQDLIHLMYAKQLNVTKEGDQTSEEFSFVTLDGEGRAT